MTADEGGEGGPEVASVMAFENISGLPTALDELVSVQVLLGLVGVCGRLKTELATGEGSLPVNASGYGDAQAQDGVGGAVEVMELAGGVLEDAGQVVAGVETGCQQDDAADTAVRLEVLDGPGDDSGTGGEADEPDGSIGILLLVGLDSTGQLPGPTFVLFDVGLIGNHFVAGPAERLEGIIDFSFVESLPDAVNFASGTTSTTETDYQALPVALRGGVIDL